MRNKWHGKMKKIILVLVTVLMLAPVAIRAADVNLKWDAVTEADGYKVYLSTDTGATWEEIGDVTTNAATAQNIADSGLMLFRISAYNAQEETIRTWSGAWYNGDWKPVSDPGGAGIE